MVHKIFESDERKLSLEMRELAEMTTSLTVIGEFDLNECDRT